MIAKVLPRQGGSTRASARKLMAYLLGKGDPQVAPDGTRLGNRHTQPRVVAGWEPARDAAWSGQCRAVDWTNVDAAWAELHVLANLIGHDLCGCAGLEDSSQVRNRVWHTILAAHPDDGLLADEQWRAIAARLMHETGLHPEGSDDPVRWVAVRHGTNEAGADHIHVMAVLLRPDGRPVSVHNDVFAAQRTARWAETQFGLTPGRGRTTPSAPSEGVRADRPSRRGDMTATAKNPPPYRRPAGMTDPTWQRVQQEGRDRMWTRQGRARAAVLSAAARAISAEHLVALVEEQGYPVTLRHSVTTPEQVTGWSITTPADRQTQRARSFTGRQLGTDCTWPALMAHLDTKGVSDRLRIVSGQEDEAMIDRAKMAAAGWGVEFIERVIAADQTLIDAGPDADPALAYWMRDVFWQVSWHLERSHGRHGVWTDAAYLYSAIAATGGVPPPPDEVHAALDALYAQWDIADGYLDEITKRHDAREAEAAAMTAYSRKVDRWADSLDTQPHIPNYLTSPGGAQYVGTAAVAIALTTADIKAQTKALAQSTALHHAHAARRLELAALAEADADYLDTQLGPWLTAAKTSETRLVAALAEHRAAHQQWRAAAGRLLAEARHAGDHQAAERVAGIDTRYRRHGAPLPTR